jgi:hypothetical protein
MIPEKWQILIDEDNIGIVGKYYTDKLGSNTYLHMDAYTMYEERYLKSHNTYHEYILDCNSRSSRTFRDNYSKNLPTINTEQFIKLIKPPIEERIKKLVI